MRAVKASAVLLVVVCLVSISEGASTNLLLVTIDTLRPDRLSCYSPDHARTPAIDALGARGVIFENAFAHTPTTLPSHTSILLGLTPLTHGVSGNSKAKVSAAYLTLAEHLKKQDYATGAFIGAFPLDSRFGLDQGFDVYDDAFPSKAAAMGFAAEKTADEVVAAAAAWLSGQTGAWFCWIHLWDPHAPYSPPEPFLSEYRNDPYSGEVAYVDAQLAVLFERLRKRGQTDRTLVVLTADHGESLGEHGELTHSYFAYNSTLHVPLIVAGPGVRPGRVASMVSHVDIFPTVCRLLGLREPPALHGRSLVPLMSGGKDRPRPIYFESLEPYLDYGCAPLRGFIEGRTKFVDSPVPEVYDLGRDFAETANLARDTDILPLKRKLEVLQKAQAGPTRTAGAAVADARTRENLRSLGYVTSPVPQVKSRYGPADDLKNFLPFQQRLERAILLNDAGRDEESVRELGALIREKSNFTPAYIYLSQIHLSRGRIDAALRTMDDGVRVNPGDYALLSEYGRALVRTRQWGPAIGILERAVSLIDYDPEPWDNLGLAQMGLGDNPKALAYFEKALALDTTSAPTYADIGAVRLTMYFDAGGKPGDLDQAIENFEKAIALDAALSPAFRGLGYAYRTAGRTEAAMAAWEKAVGLNPDDDFSTFNLGLVHLERGDKPRARQLFEKCLELKGPALSPNERDQLLALIEKCK